MARASFRVIVFFSNSRLNHSSTKVAEQQKFLIRIGTFLGRWLNEVLSSFVQWSNQWPVISSLIRSVIHWPVHCPLVGSMATGQFISESIGSLASSVVSGHFSGTEISNSG